MSTLTRVRNGDRFSSRAVYTPGSRKTKIIVTVGPASDSSAMLQQLVERGVNIFPIKHVARPTRLVATSRSGCPVRCPDVPATRWYYDGYPRTSNPDRRTARAAGASAGRKVHPHCARGTE